jgi:hypothetical protein
LNPAGSEARSERGQAYLFFATLTPLKLDSAARAEHRSKSALVREAPEDHLKTKGQWYSPGAFYCV